MSDETFRVISGNESAMAKEMECDVSHFHHVKGSNEPDRYPRFREWFRAGAYAGAPVEFWLNDLKAILAKAQSRNAASKQLSDTIVEKIQTNSDSTAELVNAISDGKLSKSECYNILEKLAKSEEVEKQLRNIVLLRLAEFGEKEG